MDITENRTKQET